MYPETNAESRWRRANEAVWRPPTDVYETDDQVVVRVEIAGLEEGDYEIVLEGRTLVVAGERRDATPKLAFQQMEIRHGKFRSQVHLPWALEVGGQQAVYENGLLIITLPKAQVRRVPVRVA
ncbi:MAG: Small heat shock protein IbpB [Chloroflexi bacterium ADurb.Bin325]|nr:MAG: Small heat shock protein IbpB [Chloroflexi bacterium ADurb.Bin325]